MRSPPRVGEEIDRSIEKELQRHGHAGAPKAGIITILMMEHVVWTQRDGDTVLRTRTGGGITRYEAVQSLRRMVGAGRIENFVIHETRKKSCTCKVGAVENTRRQRGECRCGAGEKETVPVEMIRLVLEKVRHIPPAIEPGERWRRADLELEQFCQQIVCSESSRAPGPRLPPDVQGGRADAARRALRALAPEHRRVIERAYGTATHTWTLLSQEGSRLAHLCPSVERARRDLVDRTLKERNWNPGSSSGEVTRRSVDRGVGPQDALRQKLDQAPEDEGARVRWRYEREAFCKQVEHEAGCMLLRAVEKYREARGA
jgi:hypothetical protein